ncbi:MAG: hypothetical protein RJQ04_08340 [Longimicrobiales bacterium]
MPDEGSRAGDIQRYSFLRVFANDPTIDAGELAFMQRMALADGRIDDRERATLETIFSRVSPDTVEPEVWAEIERFKARHGIG